MKRDWLQIFSNAAVVIGLAILIYEVRLSNFHARLELDTTNWQLSVDRELVTVGEAPASVLAKAIDSPGDLSLEELMIVDAYHQSALAEMWQQGYYEQFGLAPAEWQVNVDFIAREKLGYPLGRKWWSMYRGEVDENVRTIIDKALEEDPNYRVRFFERLADGTD